MTQNQSLIFSFAKNLRAQLITKCKAGGAQGVAARMW
jgi:hypothetical protein